MKKLLLTLLLFSITMIGYTQDIEVNNFKIINSELIWQKTYNTDLTVDELFREFSKTPNLYDIIVSKDSLIVCKMKGVEVKFRECGYKELTIAMYIPRSFFDFNVIIEYKQGRYRVTLKNINTRQKYKVGIREMGEVTTLNRLTVNVKKNKFRKSFTKKPSIALDYTFNEIFNILKEDIKNDNNW